MEYDNSLVQLVEIVEDFDRHPRIKLTHETGIFVITTRNQILNLFFSIYQKALYALYT